MEKVNLDEVEMGAAWWAPILEFLVQVVVGTTLFVLIAAPAIGLDYLVSWLDALGVTRPILWGLMGCEYLLFGADAFLFAVFIVRKAWKGAQKIW